MPIVNIISSPKGGGAELLVRQLHKLYIDHGLDAYAAYFSGSTDKCNKNEIVFGRSIRNPLNIFRTRRLFRCLLNRGDEELVVHVHLTWPFLYATLASLGLRNIKLVYTEHSTNNKRRSIPFYWALERLFYSRYTYIICISHAVYNALAEWLGPKLARRLVVIPNGSRQFSSVDRSKRTGGLPRLISVGSLSSRKNFVTAIAAIAELKNEIENYTIIGEGPERNRLEKLILAKELEDKVTLLGWSDSIEACLQGADILLVPSLWEGFSLVAVEGMSTGLSVVASNIDGLREVLGEANPAVTLVGQATSVKEWGSAIRKSIADARTFGVQCLAQSSCSQAERFTLERMAKRYIELYQE